MATSDLVLAYRMAFEPRYYQLQRPVRTCKGGVVRALTSYVYFAAMRLDRDRAVESFKHRGVRYDYYDPERGKARWGYCDFDVRLADARKLVFVTSCQFVGTPAEDCRIEAAECAASSLRAAFEVWTEVDLFGPNPAYMRSVVPFVMNEGLER